MYNSEVEQIIRRALEEKGAQFSEEQIQALTVILLKVTTRVVEEALSTFRPSGGGRQGGY